jgi:hypothetical protein
MRGRFADRLQWSIIVVIVLVQEILVGLIGHAMRRSWQILREKAALEWGRLRR